MLGYIYLINDAGRWVFKIGRTKNHPKIRASRIRSRTKQNILLVLYVWGLFPKRVERLAHWFLGFIRTTHPVDHGGKTEWFVGPLFLGKLAIYLAWFTVHFIVALFIVVVLVLLMLL
jgi:hypothetical protein